MPDPIDLILNHSVIPPRVIDIISGRLKHWETGQNLAVQNGKVLIAVDGKTIDIHCQDA
jgi:hypothetical protein